MAVKRIPSFLASGACLGQWWTPRNEDADETGLSRLPTRREAGILASSEAGHWALLVSGVRLPGDDTIGEGWSTQLQRQDAIWGQVSAGTCVSLLDGMRIRPRSPFGDSPEETWTGNWSAESKRAWIKPEDRANRVEIEFDVGAAWSERPRGYGYDVDLDDSWCPKLRTFTVPDTLIHEARIGGARLQLRRECVVERSSVAFTARTRTYFSIEDDVAFREINKRWVRPLFEFLSFFWLRNAKVLRVQAVDSEHEKRFDLHYSQPLAPSGNQQDEGSRSSSHFCNLGDLLAKGYEFETLLQKYFDWREAGYAPAVFLLVDSQNPLLDQSVGARLLSAIRSLETFEKARTRTNVNVKKAVDHLISTSGSVGSEITDLWTQRGGRELGNSLPELRDRYAAHGKPGDEEHFPPESELLDQEWHLQALQWLLRRQYLEEMGLDPTDTIDLVTGSTGYKRDYEAIRQHYQQSPRTPS